MRTSMPAWAALAAVAAVLCSGCGAHEAAAHGTTRGTAHGTARPSATTAPVTDDGSAVKAITAMVDLAETRNSAHMVNVQRRGTSTLTMTGVQGWGTKDTGIDVTVPPAQLGMQRMNHADGMEMRFVDGAEYLRIDPPASGPDKGKSWLRYTLAGVAPEGTDEAMEDAMYYSPVHRLLLMPSSGPVTTVGRETVDGRPTVHYRGKLAADAGFVAAQQVPAVSRVDVWIGTDGLPVRLVTDDGKLRNTTDFAGFGGVVHITAPPAAETVDMAALRKHQA